MAGQGEAPQSLESDFRTRQPIPARLLGSARPAAEPGNPAPALSERREELAEALSGRTLITHEAEEVRAFLVRDFSAAFARTRILGIDELLALTHPDSRQPDARALMGQALERDLRPGALGAARDALDVLVRVACGARAGEARYQNARGALERDFAQRLNGDQRGAVLRVLAARDYALLLGMPGTGKTTTIAFVVRALLARGRAVVGAS